VPTDDSSLRRTLVEESESTVPEDSDHSVLGRFHDLEFLAEGGMGRVLTGIDPEIGRRVAIKVLRPEIESNRLRLQKFRNEARITGLLEHPNIVPVHEAGQTPDGRVYFSMKWVQGDSLAALLSRDRKRAQESGRTPDPTPYLRHLIKVCDALLFAHDRGVVHRDLKPENLMIGRFGEVLVMDWGLARSIRTDQETGIRLDETTENPLRTLDGAVQGTPAYMPPEQALGEVNEVDEKSDVYSLGATLYEILTGTPPHRKGTTKEVLDRVRRGLLERPRDRAPEAQIPAELESVVIKAMAPDKRDRYPDVYTFQADLQAYLDGRVLEAANYNPLQLLLKWIARNRKMCVGAAAVFVLSITIFGLLRWNEARDRQQLFSAAWDEALDRLQVVNETVDIEELTADRRVVDPNTGVERKDTPQKRKDRKKAIEAYLEAAEALDRALQIHPDHADASNKRLEVGRAIGKMALQGRDYLLARQSFLQLRRHGEDTQPLIDEVDEEENSISTWREKRLRDILDDLNRGLLHPERAPGAPQFDDYYAEVLGYRDRQTAVILGANLDELTQKAQQKGDDAVWTLSERDRARFICRVLGRLGLSEGVEALGRWIRVVRDHELATEAGFALCNTRNANANSHLIAARNHLDINSPTWKQIAPFLDRIPGSQPSKTPTTAVEFFERGVLYMRKKPGKAIDDFTRAIKLDPKYAWAYTNRGNSLRRLGFDERALADYNQAIKLDPTQAAAHHNRGIIHIQRDQFDQAIADFTRCIRLNPKKPLPSAFSNRGVARMKKGDLDAAIDDFNKAIQMEPHRATHHYLLGRAWQRKGDLPATVKHFNQALRIDPKSSTIYYQRGRLYQKMDNLDAAIADYQQAVVHTPRMSAAWTQLGNCLALQKRWEEAIEAQKRAHSLAPPNRQAEIDRVIQNLQKKR
jgi:tetratricopeptide (TPR) repeat protein/tRNA A-37 threonylcarbamoyl transferase component Bud32